MNFKFIKLLYILMNAILCSMHGAARTTAKKQLRFEPDQLPKFFKSEDVIRAAPSNCVNLPPTVLSDVLGAAYNSRYMSIDPPKELEEDMDYFHQDSFPVKRNSESLQPFYVDNTFALDISDKPAWEFRHTIEEHDERSGSRNINIKNHPLMNLYPGRGRSKRNARRGNRNILVDRPWNCDAKIRWLDLGDDYFPRYLRTVECTSKKCWYNHYQCQPRSFTVKLLRRRNGECVQTNHLNRITNKESAGDLKELWVWEERAVTFCCDCAQS